MAPIENIKRPEGPARSRAREIAEREVAARELQAQQRRIEALREFAEERFKKLNRTLVFSIVWIGLLGAGVLALGFYWHDIIDWGAQMLGAGSEAAKTK